MALLHLQVAIKIPIGFEGKSLLSGPTKLM